jgi:hypothetical protein
MMRSLIPFLLALGLSAPAIAEKPHIVIVMTRAGTFEEFEGDSSEIIVAEALKFIGEQVAAGTPSFSVIW